MYYIFTQTYAKGIYYVKQNGRPPHFRSTCKTLSAFTSPPTHYIQSYSCIKQYPSYVLVNSDNPCLLYARFTGQPQTDYFCVCALIICYFHAGILPCMSLTRLLNTLIIMLRITRLVCIIYWKVLGSKPTGNCHVSLQYVSDCFVCVFCKNKWQPFICL